MAHDLLEYKGYHSRVVYDNEEGALYGVIEGIRDYVDFYVYDVSSEAVYKEFCQAVDDYLALCSDVGKEPDKEYKGSFNIRTTPDIHKRLAQKAFIENVSINKVCNDAFVYYLRPFSHTSQTNYYVINNFPQNINQSHVVPSPIKLSVGGSYVHR